MENQLWHPCVKLRLHRPDIQLTQISLVCTIPDMTQHFLIVLLEWQLRSNSSKLSFHKSWNYVIFCSNVSILLVSFAFYTYLLIKKSNLSYPWGELEHRSNLVQLPCRCRSLVWPSRHVCLVVLLNTGAWVSDMSTSTWVRLKSVNNHVMAVWHINIM